jgi:hypothetical protein
MEKTKKRGRQRKETEKEEEKEGTLMTVISVLDSCII